MKSFSSSVVACLTISFLPLIPAIAQEQSVQSGITKPIEKKAKDMKEFVAASPDEPLAKHWSLKKAADHLDRAATTWLTHWKCAACHTSYVYVMAGPSLHTTSSPAFEKMREYLEYRVTHWNSGQTADAPGQGSAIKPLPTEGVTEIVATAATLAFLDAQTTGHLRPVTRQALDRIWGIQQPNGAWTWNRTELAPLEYDDYFGAVFAALGVGAAPDGYSQTAETKKRADEAAFLLSEESVTEPAPQGLAPVGLYKIGRVVVASGSSEDHRGAIEAATS